LTWLVATDPALLYNRIVAMMQKSGLVDSWAISSLVGLASEQGQAVQELFWLWILLLAAVCLAVVVLSAARAIYLRSQQRKEADRELLEEFQEALRRGEMSPEEFARVRRLLVGRLAGEAIPTQGLPAQTEPSPEELPILESETYTESVPSENIGQPQDKEQKNDSDSPPK
jgi:uncharacterized membrane protein